MKLGDPDPACWAPSRIRQRDKHAVEDGAQVAPMHQDSTDSAAGRSDTRFCKRCVHASFDFAIGLVSWS